jgi:hypothetical protein
LEHLKSGVRSSGNPFAMASVTHCKNFLKSGAKELPLCPA